MAVRRLALLAFAAPLCTACEATPSEEVPTCVAQPSTEHPELPLAAQTDFIDIYASPTAQICLGTQRELDAQVEEIVSLFEGSPTAPPQTVPLYYTGADGPGPPCKPGNRGCVTPEDGVARTSHKAIRHELTHAVACQYRSLAAAVLSEGLANNFEPDPKETVLSEEDVAPDLNGVSLASSTDFVRYLRHAYGDDTFLQLYFGIDRMSSESEVDAAVRETYGVSLADLEAERRDLQPPVWPGHNSCGGPLWEPISEGEYRSTLTFDCASDPETYGPQGWRESTWSADLMYKRFTVEITKPGAYGVSIDKPSPDLFEPLRVAVHTCGLDDQPNLIGFAKGTAHPGNEDDENRTTVELEAGTYEVDIAVRQSAGVQAYDIEFAWEGP